MDNSNLLSLQWPTCIILVQSVTQNWSHNDDPSQLVFVGPGKSLFKHRHQGKDVCFSGEAGIPVHEVNQIYAKKTRTRIIKKKKKKEKKKRMTTCKPRLKGVCPKEKCANTENAEDSRRSDAGVGCCRKRCWQCSQVLSHGCIHTHREHSHAVTSKDVRPGDWLNVGNCLTGLPLSFHGLWLCVGGIISAN